MDSPRKWNLNSTMRNVLSWIYLKCSVVAIINNFSLSSDNMPSDSRLKCKECGTVLPRGARERDLERHVCMTHRTHQELSVTKKESGNGQSVCTSSADKFQFGASKRTKFASTPGRIPQHLSTRESKEKEGTCSLIMQPDVQTETDQDMERISRKSVKGGEEVEKGQSFLWRDRRKVTGSRPKHTNTDITRLPNTKVPWIQIFSG